MAFSAGDKLGPYEILALIGSGAMGEVWKARDTRLGRYVAVKCLKCDHSSRFELEARAIAALNHPHICQIYDIGPDYLVLEYVEGVPLKGPMETADALRLALQIAGALDAAHKHGILHRDLKPANVLVGEAGAKLLDFGLAKLKADPDPDATATAEGTVMGTAAYMSPEQALGKPLDERSDVFSFGTMLYEMVSGRRPFNGGSVLEVLHAVVRDEPLALDSPLAAIVARCMAKQPAQRFQSMAEVRTALKQVSTAKPAEQMPSIAVLPFANLSAEKENEYFSDGLAEEILIALSQIEGLRVAARSSSFSFKGKSIEMGEIASRLHVANILDGSVRRAGERVRVTVQLVDARNGFQLWSERYDRRMEDIFEVQDEISRAIADHLKVTLGVGVKQATKNLEAYENYLKGRHLLNQRMPTTVRKAIECFEQAIQLDPQFALAYSGLSDCYSILRVYGWISAEEGKPPALAAVTKAAALAPHLWEVNFSRGMFVLYYEHNWREAGPYFERSISINPQSSIAHGYCAIFYSMCRRDDEAAAHAAQACQLDPVSAFIHALSACAYHIMGRDDRAEAYARQSLELQPNYNFGLWMLGLALSSLERHQEAVETLERVVANSRSPVYVGLLGCAYERAGRSEDASRLLVELEERRARGEFIPAAYFLNIYAATGDIPAIRRTLAEAIAQTTAVFTMRVDSYSFVEPFRSDTEINRMLVELLGY
jgi:serine/threonine protein kinase/Tfp pilus assembly protein PilF